MAKSYYVDLPDPRNLEGEWVHVYGPGTKAEARAFCKANGLGDGRIDLVSEVEGVDEDDDDAE